jgi:tetratricopeptide (TPR) repeat protein
MSTAAVDPLIGRTVSHFRVVARLGGGAMGVVYRAADLSLWRDVALKVLPENVSQDGERRLRFVQEARAAAGMSHANIASVHEVGMDGGVLFIAMELVEGPSLREVMGSRIEPSRALAIGLGITRGLARAHERGVLHRDLKPENVVLDAEGTPKILDFGLARALGPHAFGEVMDPTLAGTIKGTLGYLSPEQARGEPLDARSDVYTLGLLLFELLAGRPVIPLGTPMAMLLAATEGILPPLTSLGVDVALAAVVARCCQRSPDDRYRDAGEVRDALAAIAEPPPSRHASPVEVGDLVVERDAEVASVLRELEHGAPVVALVGPAGVGTSHVAAVALRAVLARDARPTVTIALRGVRSETHAMDVIVRALGLSPGLRADPQLTLAAALRSRPRWLVLLDDVSDDALALIDQARDALGHAPGAQLLVTSRASVSGSRVAVGGLPRRGAVALLSARARHARPAADEPPPHAVLEGITRLLDGRPLALALVAPFASTAADASNTLVALAEALGPLPVDARLSALIDWVLQRLEAEERLLLQRVAAFRGDFSVEAAEAVASSSPHATAELLAALERRALVERRDGRWRMQRSVRARVRCAPHLSLDLAHGEWVARLAESARDELLAGQERETLTTLVDARDEVLAVMDRWEGGHEALGDHAAVSIAALASVLHIEGGVGAIGQRARQAAEREGLSPGPRSELTTTLAVLCVDHAPEESQRWAEEALRLARPLGDASRTCEALLALCRAGLARDRLREAAEVGEEALVLARAAGAVHLAERAATQAGRPLARLERLGEARALLEAALASATERSAVRALPEIEMTLAYVLTQAGESDAAEKHENRAIDGARRERIDGVLGTALQNRGAGRVSSGRPEEARRDLLEAAACLERRGEWSRLSMALANLSMIDWEAGRVPEALSLVERSIELLTEVGERRQRALMMAGRASLLAQLGDLDEARAAFDVAEQVAQATDERIPRACVSILRGHLELARARATTDAAERAAILATVQASIAEVFTPDGSGPPLARRSDLIRSAARTLDWVMRADAQAPAPST